MMTTTAALDKTGVVSTEESPEVPKAPMVSQEEEVQSHSNAEADASSPLSQDEPVAKRRRSPRNLNRLSFSDRSSLQYRRLDELFFQEGDSTVGRTIQIGSLSLQQVHVAPNVYVMDNFLNASELTYLQGKVDKGGFQRSYVDQIDGETSESTYDTGHRTSTFLSFDKRQDAKIAAIEQRAADLLGCWTSHSIEPLQLVRYKEGQFFGVHHDMGDYDEETEHVALPPKSLYSKRRVATVFCYLNNVESGGATYFPQAGNLRIQPVQGRAVLFSNVLPTGQPDPRTIHAGEAVKKGVKYGLNVWLCEE